jgi:coenzyme F420-reducing hydrogenase alpha subunit
VYPRARPRICGICAVGHATASLRATEQALGVTPSLQTTLLRKLNFHGEILDSHTLHIYMLVAPDSLGLGSVIPLAKSAPDLVLRALRMKQLAGDLCATLCGRHTLPISMTVGGFTQFPKPADLRALRERLVASRADCDATIQLLQGLEFPAFERETEYLALHREDEYCFIDGSIASRDGRIRPLDAYREVTNETIVPHASAKHTRHRPESYMVGALARFNINYARLHPRAQAAAEALGLRPKTINLATLQPRLPASPGSGPARNPARCRSGRGPAAGQGAPGAPVRDHHLRDSAGRDRLVARLDTGRRHGHSRPLRGHHDGLRGTR